MDPLHVALRKLARRMSLHQWLMYTVTAVFYSTSAACVWLMLTRLFPALGDPLPVSGAILVTGLIIAAVVAVLRRPTPLRAALEADKRLGLNERLTSSLALAEADGPMIAALHSDARRKLDTLNLRRHFPLTSNRLMRWTAIPLLVFGMAYTFLPEFDLLNYTERQVEAKVKEDALAVRVERLKSAVKPLEEQPLEDATALAEITGLVEKMADDLRTGVIGEKQALAKLSNLADKLEQQRDAMANKAPEPKVVGDLDQLGLAKDMAAAMQDGNMQKAAAEAKKMAEKLKEGNLSKEEMEKLAKDLGALAKMMGGPQSELGEALAKAMAKASDAMKAGDTEGAKEALEQMEMSLEDMESIMNQLAQMDAVMANLSEWQQDMLGPSEYCRICGAKLAECSAGEGQCDQAGHEHSGVCGSCAGNGAGGGQGLGMGGPGRGRGNQVGELPNVQTGFQPAKDSGPMTKGRMLADILQKTAPEEGAESTVEYISGAFVEVQQAAEQALNQEEIPAGSKEFVRQYFGSLEPEEE